MEYCQVKPNDNETFQQLNQRLHLNFLQGSGYYKLTKAEKISAHKDLVLYHKNSWIAGASNVRSKLNLGSGSITVKPSHVPEGGHLYIQSTSWNRKLRDGHEVLFRKGEVAGGSGVKVNVHSSCGKKKEEPVVIKATAAKRKRNGVSGRKPKNPKTKGGNDDDEDDDDKNPKPDATPSEDTNDIVAWDTLLFELSQEVECLDESPLVAGADESNVPGDCDLPVPNHLIQEAVSKVVNGAIRGVTEWTPLETTVIEPTADPDRPFAYTPTLRRYQWQGANTHGQACRLLYVDSPNANFIALQLKGISSSSSSSSSSLEEDYGLVCGNCGAHPFVHSPDFLYANSDGSSSDVPLRGLITPEIVLAKLVHDTVLHCENSEH